jgi:two-component system NtrC family sensor kinase
MKLATKLVLLFLGCLAMVVCVFSILSVRQAKELALAEHERHAADLAATLQSALRQSPQMLEDVEQVLEVWSREVRYVRVRLVNPRRPGDLSLSPSVPAELVMTATEVTTVIYPAPSGQRTMYTYVPLDDGNGTKLEVAAPESFWTERLTHTLRSSAIALLAVSLASSLVILVGGYWMVGRPLDALVEKVKRIGQGDLSQPVELGRQDELGRLGQSVNAMCEQLAGQRARIESETEQRIAAVEQLRHADRLRTVGRLAAGLAHEIGTPLNVVSGRAELISSGRLSAAEVLQSAQTIKAQSQRIAGIVQQLLDFSRHRKPQRQSVDLNDCIRETIELIKPIAEKRGVMLTLETPDGQALAKIDAYLMDQVFANLLLNAVQASAADSGQQETSRQPRIHVRVVSVAGITPPGEQAGASATPGDYWKVVFEDNGCGIDQQDIEHIFEPFFTTKDVGEGTGLGLSIAYGIVQEHNGWISVESELGKGSVSSRLDFGVHSQSLRRELNAPYFVSRQRLPACFSLLQGPTLASALGLLNYCQSMWSSSGRRSSRLSSPAGTAGWDGTKSGERANGPTD